MKTRSLLRFALASLLLAASMPAQSVAQDTHAASATVKSVKVGMRRNSIASVIQLADGTPLEKVVGTDTTIQPAHRQAIIEVLRYMPAACQAQIKNLYVRYDHPEERGLAGKDTVVVSGSVPLAEFRALLVHEVLGHVMDLGCLTGSAQSGTSEFHDGNDAVYRNDPSLLFYRISWQSPTERKPSMTRSDFVSGYAHDTDCFEDFAESATFYFLHREEFRRMALKNPVLASKFAWFETYEFQRDTLVAFSTYHWDVNNIPWDATKLPYTWASPALSAR